MTLDQYLAKVLKRSESLYERRLGSHRAVIRKAYKEALDGIRLELAKLYEKQGDVISLNDAKKYGRLESLEHQIEQKLKEAELTTKRVTRTAIKDSYKEAYYNAGYAYESGTGMRFGFASLPEAKIKAIVLNPLDRVTWIARTTSRGKQINATIRSKIAQGLAQGKGYQFIAADIKTTIQTNVGDLFKLVRTETHRAHQTAGIEAYQRLQNSIKQSGLDIKPIRFWISTLDSKTRDTHQSADGQEEDKQGMFHVGGVSMPAPGLSGVAKEDINCRCTVGTRIDGLSEQKRLDNRSKTVGVWDTYKDWKKDKGIK